MSQRAQLIFAYALSALFSAASAGALFRRRRRSPGAGSFALVLALETFWTVAGIAELLSPTLGQKRFWDDVQLIPAMLVQVEIVFFALAYVGRSPADPMRTRLALSVLPLACIAFVYTDAWHGIARPDARIVPSAPFDLLLYDFTSLELLTFTYSYGLILFATALLVWRLFHEHPVHRFQTGVALAAMLLPSATSVPMLFEIRVFGQRDFTPLVFGLSGVLIAIAIARRRFLDLLPIARDAVIESVSDALVLLDARHRVVDVNRAARELLGRSLESLLGSKARDVHPVLDELVRSIAPGQSMRLEVRTDVPMGERDYEALVTEVRDPSGLALGTAILMRDVTERRLAADALRRQLQTAQKMESIGRLAGGVAHDFNNLLTAILCSVDLIQRRTKDDPRLTELVQPVRRAAESAATLTRQLLAFSRNRIVEPELLDLDRSIERVQQMLARVLGEDVDLRFEPNAGGAHVVCDVGQLEQVLLNLAVNARDAIGRHGTITIGTRTTTVSVPTACTDGTTREAGEYVTLFVEDSGSGIPDEVLGRIFDPFFTTKPEGRGTGLGLAMVRDVAQQHSGHIDVRTRVGAGTTFELHLPRAEPPPVASAAERSDAEPPGGHERILLVEDQALVRETMARTLERFGYRVVACESTASALVEVGARADALDLLITDVVLGDGSGRELAERLRSAVPGMPVLFVSGYTDDVVLRHGIEHGELFYLAKPFSEWQLALAVRQALDDPSTVPTGADGGVASPREGT